MDVTNLCQKKVKVFHFLRPCAWLQNRREMVDFIQSRVVLGPGPLSGSGKPKNLTSAD